MIHALKNTKGGCFSFNRISERCCVKLCHDFQSWNAVNFGFFGFFEPIIPGCFLLRLTTVRGFGMLFLSGISLPLWRISGGCFFTEWEGCIKIGLLFNFFFLMGGVRKGDLGIYVL